MIIVTKVSNIEIAHALYNYGGSCSSIHSHSYVLHITVKTAKERESKLTSPGSIIDFKQLEDIANSEITALLDYK